MRLILKCENMKFLLDGCRRKFPLPFLIVVNNKYYIISTPNIKYFIQKWNSHYNKNIMLKEKKKKRVTPSTFKCIDNLRFITKGKAEGMGVRKV